MIFLQHMGYIFLFCFIPTDFRLITHWMHNGVLKRCCILCFSEGFYLFILVQQAVNLDIPCSGQQLKSFLCPSDFHPLPFTWAFWGLLKTSIGQWAANKFGSIYIVVFWFTSSVTSSPQFLPLTFQLLHKPCPLSCAILQSKALAFYYLKFPAHWGMSVDKKSHKSHHL